MDILLAANEEFIEYSKKLLFSIRKNNRCNITVHFLYLYISKEKLQKLKDYAINELNIKIHFYQLDIEMFQGLPTTNKKGDMFFGPEAYLRLFAQFVLPNEIEKVLYMDIDIICNGSLEKLYNVDLYENVYAGCEDVGANINDKKRVGFEIEDKYMNSGVLLMNLKKLRKMNSISSIKDYIYSRKDVISYPDQDIINMLYKDALLFIDKKYNYTQFKNQKKINNAILYHYIGKNKPWKLKSTYCIKYQFFKVYVKYIFLEKEYKKSICLYMYYLINRPLYLIKKFFGKLKAVN